METGSYEQWFVEQYGPRPILPGGARERVEEVRRELAALEAMVEKQREWDLRYMMGRAALDRFNRRDV